MSLCTSINSGLAGIVRLEYGISHCVGEGGTEDEELIVVSTPHFTVLAKLLRDNMAFLGSRGERGAILT